MYIFLNDFASFLMCIERVHEHERDIGLMYVVQFLLKLLKKKKVSFNIYIFLYVLHIL